MDNSQPVCNSMFCKTESMSNSNKAPMKKAAMAWAEKVRKPMCLLAEAAAKPAKPIMPTMLTTLALKKAAMQGDQETLTKILAQVMSTQDGKALVKKISESFGK